MKPTLSIITPCFNPNKELINTIRSIQVQSFKDYEHIIIDDCSTKPFSEELLEIIDSDPKILFIKRSWNAGPAVTRNRGISEAKGKYIAFLDADDTWLPDKLEKQVAFMEKTQCPLSYTNYNVVDEEGTYLGTREAPLELSYRELIRVNRIGCLTAMYNTEICGKQYMPNILKRQDYGLWLKITKKFGPAQGIDEVLAKYRSSKRSLSGNKLKVLKYQWRLYREIENLSLLKSLYCLINHAWNGISRKA
ncbi:glycosyltransferase family 2 protein [Wohlfahrtiimonas sp. G9077]|uniref:glycosyltransferase family 2 protein n=1 Tax=Wohlfahrtiimonas sp. G9077 TaxID=1980118 RepID=UPI000B98E78D|nr:glycosyltransferase family 2 protein [Wohlfahrtiimonas sp. G9077]OYQ72529.1 glycosyl transferase [Wohlfahrtiimonas sp. G9077]